MVKQHVQHQHRRRHPYGQRHVGAVQRQDGAEHKAVHIGGHAGGEAGDHHTGGQGGGTDHGDGRIRAHAAPLRHPQQAQRRQYHHGDGHRQRRPAAGQRNAQCAEGHVAQSVADHGVALQHQRHAQQRRAQGDQDAHHKGPQDKGVGEHFQQQAHIPSPPNRFP